MQKSFTNIPYTTLSPYCKGSKVDSTLPLFIVWLFLLFNSLPTPSPHCHYLPFPLLLILHCPFTAFMIFLLFHHFIIMQCSSALYFVSLFNYLTPSWHSYPVQVQPHDVLFILYFRDVLEVALFSINLIFNYHLLSVFTLAKDCANSNPR